MGAWMRAQGIIPDIIFSSPAVRAGETARLAAEAMHLVTANIIDDPAIYEGGRNELLQVVQTLPKTAGRVLLVGHNSGIDDLVLFLSGGTVVVPSDGKLMPTAALARFVISGAWGKLAPDRAKFIEIIRPRLLAKEIV